MTSLIILKTIILLIIPVLTLQAGDIKSDSEKIIRAIFKQQMEYQFEKYELDENLKHSIEKSVKQKFFGKYVYVWYIYQADTLTGITILDNVYGKTLPITFMVIFDSKGHVLKSSIIRYREPYGGSVSSTGWLGQFIGLNAMDEMKLGDNIDSITGATISSRSMTLGIKKLSILANHLLIKNEKDGSKDSPLPKTEKN